MPEAEPDFFYSRRRHRLRQMSEMVGGSEGMAIARIPAVGVSGLIG